MIWRLYLILIYQQIPLQTHWQLLIPLLHPRLPGACNSFLTGYCSQFSRDSIANSPILADFCGCYAPVDTDYSKYIAKQCDPLCHRVQTVQFSNQDGTLKECDNTVCVIDDVSIELTQSTVSGGINITNVCPGCSGSNCTCVISGVNLTNTLSDVNLSPNSITQFCGANAVCLDVSGAVPKIVECQNIPQKSGSSSVGSIVSWVVVVGIIILILFVIGIVLAFRKWGVR